MPAARACESVQADAPCIFVQLGTVCTYVPPAVQYKAPSSTAGTTWRRLDDATQAGVVDDASATALMLAEPSVIKRPVVRWPDGRLTLGFSAEAFEKSALSAPNKG